MHVVPSHVVRVSLRLVPCCCVPYHVVTYGAVPYRPVAYSALAYRPVAVPLRQVLFR